MKITILMSTYNGSKFLNEQIESLRNQIDVRASIIVRDDGSTDNTIDILETYQKQGVLKWYTGQNLRPAKSFMNLLFGAPDSEYYAFSDQDDVWMPEKLSIAIEKIKDIQGPALYCSDTLLVDSFLQILRPGGIKADGTFVESLISNPVTGCTMVFNKALRDIVCQYQPQTIDMHDWWIYRICMAVDGSFVFDTVPHIQYRQHENNVIGGQGSKWHRFMRHLNYFLHPTEGIRFTMAKELQKGFSPLLSDENKKVLDMITSYKDSIIKTFILANSPIMKISSKTTLNTFKKAVLLHKY